MAVLLLFFLSGATALVYEVIWSKYLALMFGSTVQAQTVALAVFMGGLALGNRIFGRRSGALKQPLAVYGYIELAIGLYAFFFHSLYTLADNLFITVGSRVAESPNLLLSLKGALATGLLIVPTVLMGGTLPLLAAWLERRSAEPGRGSARFYSTNSLGAVFGAAVAGFYLVREWGMLASLQLAAFVNLAVALAAIAISRQGGDAQTAPQRPPAGEGVLPTRMALALVTVTGGVSMGLEVLCSRAVALIVGGSLQSFAIVLMAFILGIGTGAGIVASPKFARFQRQQTVFALLLGAAGLIALFIYRVEDWAILYSAGRYALAPNESGYVLHQFLVGVLAIVTLGIPAGLLGAVLPMAIRAGGGGGSLGDQVGRLLTWNTCGAVAGVLVTGFVLMPLAGLRGSFLILALILAGIGSIGAWRTGSPRTQWVGVGAVAATLMLFASGGETWRHVLGAGLYRLRGLRLTHEAIDRRQAEVKIHFYKDAPDATVAVETGANPDEPQQLILRINGKADASTHGDLPTQYLLGHLPLMARPEGKDIFILGFGSGITAGAALGHPIDSLTIAENCAPVIEAAPLFAKWNRNALDDPRTRLRTEDARTVLKLSGKKYDAIISEPSNPWVAGIGSVFSREFYELCGSRLKEGGMMAQWFHIYEMHDGIVELVIRTFTGVFPYVELWEPENGDIILLGSMTPWEATPAVYQKVFERERPRRDLAEIGLGSAVALLARQMASQGTAFAIAGEGATQSDEFPALEYAAPEAFFIGRSAQRLFTFDERTRQSALAPALKRRTLQALPEPVLHGIYSDYSTANPDLLKYLKWRAARVRPLAEHPVYDLDPELPVIFRPPNSYAAAASPAGGPPAALLQAEAEILRQSDKTADAVRETERLLLAEETGPATKRAWKPARFAVAAARAALALRDFAATARLLDLGRKFEPENVELGYLQRLLDAQATTAK